MTDELSSKLASLRLPEEAGDARPRPSRRRRWVGLGLLASAALAGAAALVGARSRSATAPPPSLSLARITASAAAEAPVIQAASGHVLALEAPAVGALKEGRVARVAVEEGQQVEAGDVLLVLDDREIRAEIDAALSRAEAQRQNAGAVEAHLGSLRDELQRQQQLVAAGAAARTSQIDLEARVRMMESLAESLQTNARASRAQAHALELSRRGLTIRAPISGTVMSRPPRVGEIVGSGPETAIRLADLRSLAVETDVPESRISRVAVGGPCEIELDAFAGTRWRGTVHSLGWDVNRAKGTVTVVVRFDEPSSRRIVPGMAAQVRFLEPSRQGEQPAAGRGQPAAAALVVPVSAVLEREDGPAVLALDDHGVVRWRRVAVGRRRDDVYELLEGPPAGTSVVDRPPATMKDGDTVRSPRG